MANVLVESDEYILVAAIDFGTTFSGYAFSFKTTPEEIKMNKNWGSNMGFQSYKTPTSVLLDPSGAFDSFGYEAEVKYGEVIESEGDPEGWNIFRHFKMSLHSQQKLTREKKIHSTSGYIRPAMDIFVMALKYLKTHLIDSIGKQLVSGLDERLIKWVITVPAIWSEESKQFMREAAFKAGYITTPNSRQLVIALEPEAASVSCRRLDVSSFKGISRQVRFETGAKYLVIDCGGGTVDVTAHEILPSGSVRELHSATGGAWGGTKVDENFMRLLDKVFGTKFINEYRKQYPQQWLVMMTGFERIKRSAKPDGTSSINLPLSWSLGTNYSKIMGQDKTVEQAINDSGHLGVKFGNGTMIIQQSALKAMFEPVLDIIVSHIENLWSIPKIQPCKYFFLVGGFSESEFLQKTIMDRFSDRVDVLVPSEAQMSVIKGAVLFGHKPSEIKSRVARRTYGYGHLSKFDPQIHKLSKKTVREGVELCDDLFGVFVQQDEEVDIGKMKITRHNPTTSDQNAMDIIFYCLDDKPNLVQYVDELGVERLGALHIDMPITSGGKSREVELQITFGGTEIQADATDLTSGNKAHTTINFLSG